MENSIFTISELKSHYNSIKELLINIQADSSYMKKSLDMLERMPAQSIPGDIAGQAKANAAMQIVKYREDTNNRLIDAAMKLYSDISGVMFEKYLSVDSDATASADSEEDNADA